VGRVLCAASCRSARPARPFCYHPPFPRPVCFHVRPLLLALATLLTPYPFLALLSLLHSLSLQIPAPCALPPPPPQFCSALRRQQLPQVSFRSLVTLLESSLLPFASIASCLSLYLLLSPDLAVTSLRCFLSACLLCQPSPPPAILFCPAFCLRSATIVASFSLLELAVACCLVVLGWVFPFCAALCLSFSLRGSPHLHLPLSSRRVFSFSRSTF